MIHITIDNLDGLMPETAEKLSGLLHTIAKYNSGLLEIPGDTIVNLTPKGEQALTANQAFGGNVTGPAGVEVYTAPESPPPSIPPAAQAPGIDVDVNGLPWDGRIHASSKKKNADGSWRNRRNLDEEVLKKVTAELKGVMAAPFVAPADSPSTPPDPTVIAPPPVPITPPPPTIPTSVQDGSATVASPGNFIQLMGAITNAYSAKTITQEMVAEAVQAVGLPSLPMVQQRPDLIPAIVEKLGLQL